MEKNINAISKIKSRNKSKTIWLIIFAIVVLALFILSISIGSSYISLDKVFSGLFGQADDSTNLIIQNIRLPRAIAALVCGIGLGVCGVIMQTNLNNPLSSPSTLGVSNAGVFGANIAILIITGGATTSVNRSNPYLTITFAFISSILCVGLILALAKFKNFSPTTIILVGVALSTLFAAGTTLLQYFADDNQLANMVHWNFGSLVNVDNFQNLFIGIFMIVCLVFFMFLAPRYNAMLSGDDVAQSLGVNTKRLRIISLFIASLIIAISISFFGAIGFIGIMAPHIVRRLIGSDHRFLIPGSALFGVIILQISDILARVILGGYELPVGAITAILGAPFFLFLVFTRNGGVNHD